MLSYKLPNTILYSIRNFNLKSLLENISKINLKERLSE